MLPKTVSYFYKFQGKGFNYDHYMNHFFLISTQHFGGFATTNNIDVKIFAFPKCALFMRWWFYNYGRWQFFDCKQSCFSFGIKSRMFFMSNFFLSLRWPHLQTVLDINAYLPHCGNNEKTTVLLLSKKHGNFTNYETLKAILKNLILETKRTWQSFDLKLNSGV